MNPNVSTDLPPDRTVYQGSHLSMVKRSFVTRSGSVAEYEVAVRTQVENQVRRIVAGLAITKDKSYVLTMQYRIPLQEDITETPAGLVDANEDLATAMRRELLEETGYAGGEISWVGRMPTSSGMTNEVVECFLVDGVEKIAEPELEGAEFIETVVVPDSEFDAFIAAKYREGCIVDSKISALVLYYRAKVAGRI